MSRLYRAGESIEDYCRACKTDRLHTVIVTDASGGPLRVACGYCHSEHNYRGGPRIEPSGGRGTVDSRSSARSASTNAAPSDRASVTLGAHESAASSGQTRAARSDGGPAGSSRGASDREPFPIVSEREVTMNAEGSHMDLERLLRRVIREETGITPVAPADRWRGGQLVLRPSAQGVQEKSWPIETFFHKVVMLRNRLRTLEQQINAAELPDDVKVKLQGYITGCYGSLTSFNVLFADEDDQFKGSGGD
jgi:hypothetical protein